MRISDWSSDVCSSDLGQGSAFDLLLPVDDLRNLGQSNRPTAALRDDEGEEAARVLESALELDHAILASLRDAARRKILVLGTNQIGRASCRERVCRYV